MSFGEMLRNAGSNDYIEPPKGQYSVKIVDGSASQTKHGPRVGIVLEIQEDTLKDARFEHAMFFNHPVGMEINKEALVSYGVDITKIEEVEDLNAELDRVMGTIADVGVSYNDRGYLQIKVHGSRTNGQSELTPQTEEQPAASFATAAGADSDVPF